jgi:hypothetical protein
MPILITLMIVMVKAEIYNDNDNNDNIKKEFNINIKNSIRPVDPKSFSSGRFSDWSKIINKIGQSKIYGFGAQGDRFIINQSASNAFLYALSSAGILGLSLFFLFTLNSLWILIKFYFFYLKSGLKKEFFIAIVILLLMARSIFESSYSVFSVDYIIYYSFLNYLSNFCIKNND